MVAPGIYFPSTFVIFVALKEHVTEDDKAREPVIQPPRKSYIVTGQIVFANAEEKDAQLFGDAPLTTGRFIVTKDELVFRELFDKVNNKPLLKKDDKIVTINERRYEKIFITQVRPVAHHDYGEGAYLVSFADRYPRRM